MLAPDEWSGRKLGKYEILCRLSTGGMSEIFLAFQRGLAGFRKFIVLKQILPDIKGEEEFVRMFLDEAKITAAFNHPNIAQVYDLDVAEGDLFLAMEFVPGATLVEVARACRQLNEPIPIGFTLMAVRDTALALHYAHNFTDPTGRVQQVIHRDIAEKNIMVTYDGATKLLDFGIAKALNRATRTSVGMVKGTSGYMSPEQILGEKLDARSDLFSLGVVLHECLTGMRLFHARNAEEAMLQVIKGETAPPSKQNPQISAELDAVTVKALQRQRDSRYASCLEFARALERAAAGKIWHPEEAAPFIQRLFAERREQTGRLMSQANFETTGNFSLSQLLDAPPPKFSGPPPLPEPVTKLEPPAPPVSAPPVPTPKKPVVRGSGARAAVPPATPRRGTQSLAVQPLEKAPRRLKDAPPPVVTPVEHTEEITIDRKPIPKSALPYEDDAIEDRTIPATHLSPEELADILGEAADHDALKEELTAPGASRLPVPDDERSVTVSTRDGTFDETHPGHPTHRARGGLVALVALVLIVAGLGGATYAFGLHHRVMEALQDPEVAANPSPMQPMAVQPVVLQPVAVGPETVAAPVVVQPEPDAEAEPEPEAVTQPVAVKVEAEPAPVVPAVVEKVAARVELKAKPRTTRPKAAPKPVIATPVDTTPEEDPPPVEHAADDAWEQAEEKARSKTSATPGTLTLVTEPWATVYLGGKEIGITPLVKHALPAGKHVLKLVGPDKAAVSLTVEINAENDTKVRVPLSALKPL